MKLSEHFTLEELTATNTGLLNIPNDLQLINLRCLATNILEPLRVLYDKPIKVNSGFRSKSVNKKVGGAKTSHHCFGQAADLTCDNNALLFRLIRDTYDYTQLIWEGGDDKQPAWVHVSWQFGNLKKEVLKMKKGKYYPYPKIA